MIDSNELTRKIKTPLNPRAALIAYASEGDKNFFLEIRGIDDRGNMTEGRPVTLEFMNTLVKEVSEAHFQKVLKRQKSANSTKKSAQTTI